MSTKKYVSEYEKLKKEKEKRKTKIEKLIESQRGVLNKFVISNKQNIEDNLGEKLINE